MAVSGQLHAPATLPPGKEPSVLITGGWSRPKAGLNAQEKGDMTLPLAVI